MLHTACTYVIGAQLQPAIGQALDRVGRRLLNDLSILSAIF